MSDALQDNPDSAAAQDGDFARRILEFAGQLGPHSERLLAGPDAQQAVRARIAAGKDLADAVLGYIHSRLRHDHRLADEFAAFFVFDLMLMGSISMASSSRLRRFLDTGDLVLSVFGDVWEDFEAVRFESRGQYKRLFAQRLEWKAADQARRMSAGTRREDLRVGMHPDEVVSAGQAEPVSDVIRREEREQLILILLRLKERERRLLTLHLKGQPLEAIATAEGLSLDAARKALERAVAQARQLAQCQAAAAAARPGT